MHSSMSSTGTKPSRSSTPRSARLFGFISTGDRPEPPFVDVASVARRTGAHPNTVRAAIHAGELPARRLGRGFLVHARDVEEWAPRQRGRPARSPAVNRDALLEAFNTESTA